MLQYVIAHLIAGVLRPLVWAALAVLAVAFVVTVPARLWLLYVDSEASARTITALHWAAGVLVVSLWLARWVFPLFGRMLGHLAASVWRQQRLRPVASQRSRADDARRFVRWC